MTTGHLFCGTAHVDIDPIKAQFADNKGGDVKVLRSVTVNLGDNGAFEFGVVEGLK